MKSKILSFLLLSTIFLQCQNKKDDRKDINNSIMKNDKIQETDILNINKLSEILENQKKLENEETEDEYQLSQNDLDVLSDVLSQGLKNQGYKIISNEDFIDKIKNVFNINTKCVDYGEVGNRYFVYHGNAMDGRKETLENNLFESYTETGNLFFDKKNKLITNFTFLKNILSINGKDYSINVPQTTLARNKYLFNDSKADFTWLKFNDKIFLESLVKTFGYVNDKDLLAFVLENNYQKQEELEKIVWNRKCEGEFVVNKEVFNLAKNWKTEKRHDFLMYMLFVVQKMKKEFESNNELTFSQKAKVLGLISYYATQIGNIDNTHAYSFFPMLSGKNYDDEFKKNNYYNIPDFKAVYEDTRTGGIDIDNWVQPDFSLNKTKIPNTDKPIIIYDRADFNSFSTEITVKNEIEYLSKISGWDFVRVDGRVGYLPSQGQIAEAVKTERKKHSFLADNEPLPEKKKGFWDRLFG